jgi:hypothetical protein
MKRWVEFPLEDGATMLVETEEPDQGGLVKASREDNVIVKALLTLEKSVKKARHALAGGEANNTVTLGG